MKGKSGRNELVKGKCNKLIRINDSPQYQTSPTAFPTTPLYARVTIGTYFANATTVPMAVRRKRKLEATALSGPPGERGRHGALNKAYRQLATTPVEACYQACYNFYSPAPNNAQFLFQLVNVGANRVCQCCKTCGQQLDQPGALLLEACVPSPVVRVGSSMSRKYVKASGAKPVRVTYTLRVKGTVKNLPLRDMGVQMTVPAGAEVVEAFSGSRAKGTRGSIEGNTVLLYPLTLNRETQTFKVRVVLTPPFTGSELRFQGAVVQNAHGLASEPYCTLSARDMVVRVQYP